MQAFCCDIPGWKKCHIARELLLQEEEAEELDAEERERLNAKIQAQNREIKLLRKKLEDADIGLKQLNKSVDSILAVTCREFGETLPDDQWELRLPEVDIQKTLKRYTVTARKDPESGSYIIRCARRK